MTHETKAKLLAEALLDLFPALEIAVVPVSAPVASLGVAVAITTDHVVTYVPALESWWTLGDADTEVQETELTTDASPDAVVARIAFDVANHLVDAGLVVGHETSTECDLFGALVRQLTFFVESDDEEDRVPAASLYLALLNANLEDARVSDAVVVENPLAT